MIKNMDELSDFPMKASEIAFSLPIRVNKLFKKSTVQKTVFGSKEEFDCAFGWKIRNKHRIYFVMHGNSIKKKKNFKN